MQADGEGDVKQGAPLPALCQMGSPRPPPSCSCCSRGLSCCCCRCRRCSPAPWARAVGRAGRLGGEAARVTGRSCEAVDQAQSGHRPGRLDGMARGFAFGCPGDQTWRAQAHERGTTLASVTPAALGRT